MRRIAAFAALCLFAACGPNKAFRVQYPVGKPPQIDPIEKTDKYRLAFVEFDDQGEMFERGQLAQVLDMISEARRDAAKIAAASGKDADTLVVTFVHAWKITLRRNRVTLAVSGTCSPPCRTSSTAPRWESSLAGAASRSPSPV
jgi:hypothetical protein